MSQDPYNELLRQQARQAKQEVNTEKWMGRLLKVTVLVFVLPIVLALACGGWFLFEVYTK